MNDKVTDGLIILGAGSGIGTAAAMPTNGNIWYDIVVRFVIPVLAGATIAFLGFLIKRKMNKIFPTFSFSATTKSM